MIVLWVARMHDTDRIIAYGTTYMECSQNAADTGIWDMSPGSCAPYYISKENAITCGVCEGNGKLHMEDLSWDCPNCNAVGIVA